MLSVLSKQGDLLWEEGQTCTMPVRHLSGIFGQQWFAEKSEKSEGWCVVACHSGMPVLTPVDAQLFQSRCGRERCSLQCRQMQCMISHWKGLRWRDWGCLLDMLLQALPLGQAYIRVWW